jgi:flagellar hook-associated protein 2
MTAGSRNKINRQYQAKQKLLYKQEAYREISTKLISFSNKYFSYSSGSKDNILSPGFFQSYTYKSSSEYVNVTGNAENIQNFSINNITSVARAANFASNKRVSSDTITSAGLTDYTSTLAGGTMTIEHEGKSYNLSIDKGFGNTNNLDAQITLDDVAYHLNEKIQKIEGLSDLSVTVEAGILSIISSEDKAVKLTAASSSVLDNLNFEVGKAVASTSEVEDSSLTKEAANILANENSYITFEYNGVLKKINLNSSIDKENIVSHLSTELNKAFGTGKITVNEDLSFTANEGDTNIFGISSISRDLGNYLDIESGDYNRLNRNKSLAESGLLGIGEVNTVTNEEGKEVYRLTVNGVNLDFETNMSVTDVINKINSDAEIGIRVYYSATIDTFTVKATETGSHKGISVTADDNPLAQVLFGISEDINEKGTDTEMTYTLNGVEKTIIRSTANFSIDEIKIELNEKATEIDFTNAVTFDVTNNSDEVVERVKQFINDYNEIISLISTKTGEKPSNEYPPLTPEQQDDMSEEEIKNWTKEAKKGMLYGDRKMNNILRNMREAMSGATDVSNLILSNIGISSAGMDTSGKLVLDEKVFKEKLLENPDEIARLFTNTASEAGGRSGIAVQLQTILRNNVGAYGTTGLLIEEAGMDNSMTSDRNYISEKIEEHDEKMAELKKAIERERERYWKQFSALEQSLNRLNMQSSWLTDMMGDY